MSLHHVHSGDPLAIPADGWNKIVDATKAFYENQAHSGVRRPAGAGLGQAGVILVKNDTGEDRKRFEVLGIDKPIVSQDDNADEFKRGVALSCVAPTTPYAGRFVVLLEPVAHGQIGRACIDGVTLACVDMQNAGDRFADVPAPRNGGSYVLKSGASGAAQILWNDGTTGQSLAVVRLGAPSPPSDVWIMIDGPASTPADGRYEASLMYSISIDANGVPQPHRTNDSSQMFGSATGTYIRHIDGITNVPRDSIARAFPLDDADNPGSMLWFFDLPGRPPNPYQVVTSDENGAKKWDWIRAHT